MPVCLGVGLLGAGSSLLFPDTTGVAAAAASPVPVSKLDLLQPKAPLVTAAALGVSFVQDDLTTAAARRSDLAIRTTLPGGASFGRGNGGFFVPAGAGASEVEVALKSAPALGNRSVLARIEFFSTQTGVREGEHGRYELRLANVDALVNGTRLRSVRARVDNGRFYLLDWKDKVVAGSDTEVVFRQSPNKVYTLELLLFEKGIFARLRGPGVKDGNLDLTVPDSRRWIPSGCGFALTPASGATGGEVVVKNWLVTPVGPQRALLGAIGDSITGGSVDRPEKEDYVCQVARGLGQPLTLNVGAGGATTGQDAARFPFEIAPFRPRLVWIEGGTNDISANVSAEAIWANWQKQKSLVNWGGIAVFSTVPPRRSFSVQQQEQRRLLNDRLRTSGLPFVDRDAAVRSGSDPNRLDLECDSGDGTHLTAEGNRRISRNALAVMLPLVS